ncbi:hypothetical protein B0J17DRAFT_719847 [Rhizoctonia solani]|nr:hypothetical protein B0J17DRAFT_719847 [Rhizoctonia solani]
MIDLDSSPLSSDEIQPEQPAQGISHARQDRHPPPRVPAKVLTAEVPVHTSRNSTVFAQVPLAWPSIAEHDPEVNLSVTRFLLILQHLYDVYMAWGGHQATTRDVRDAFNELVEQWHAVEDSYKDCCRKSVKEAEEGLAKIRRLCSSALSHEGPNWILMKENQSQFSSGVRDEVIEKLKELHHYSDDRA